MLDVVVLLVCGKKIAAMCKEKNRAAWPWILMLVGFWFGGLLAGAVVGAIIIELTDPKVMDDPFPVPLVLGALGGGVVGLIITFTTVNLLPANEDEPRRRYEDDDDDRPDRLRDDYGEDRRRYDDDRR